MHPNLLFWRQMIFFSGEEPTPSTTPNPVDAHGASPLLPEILNTPLFSSTAAAAPSFTFLYTSKLPYTTFAKLFRDKCPRMCRNCLGKFSNRQDTTHFHGTLLAPTNRNRFPRNILWTTSRIVRFLSCIMQIKNLQDAVYLKLYKPKL